MATTSNTWTLKRILPWLLLICGSIAVIASAILTNELLNHYKNPHYVPVCNLNPIFSCSTVTTSEQAHAFGLPNEFIGLAGFAAVATTGAAILAGAQFKRWFWRLFSLGMLFAVVFLSWLQFQTIYRIGALCLFCMVIWAVIIPAFWYTSLYSLREGHITTPKRLSRMIAFIQRHHADILFSWFLIIIALILKRFWYYFGNL